MLAQNAVKVVPESSSVMAYREEGLGELNDRLN
jgi:hypothetical protein